MDNHSNNMRFSWIIRGFFLTEMLVILLILTILSLVTSNNLTALSSKTQDNQVLSQLSSGLSFARQLAIFQGKAVAVCISDDLHTCERQGKKALLIFYLDLTKKDISNIIDQQLIQIVALDIPQGMKVSWIGFPQHQLALIFLPSGETDNQNGSFWYVYSAQKTPKKLLIISKSGRWHFNSR